MPETNTPEQPTSTQAAAVQFDQSTMNEMVRTAMQQMQAPEAPLGAPSGDGQRFGAAAIHLNANAGQEERGATALDAQVRAAREIALEDIPSFDPARMAIETDPRRRAFLGIQLFRLFRGQLTRNYQQTAEAQMDLARRGFYGDAIAGQVLQGNTRALSTLTDANGAVFIPEVVYNEVLRIVPNYGAIRRLGRVISVDGPVRIPNLATGLVAFWVGEAQVIKARKPAFGKVTLDPEKIGLIVPWTSEVREEVGASLLDLIVTLIAEAFGLLEDQTALYGDGTATYGGVTGLASAAGVNSYVLGGATNSGSTTFADITYDDLAGAMKKVPAPVRRMGTWVLHPDTSMTLAGLKDTTGKPIFEADYREGGIDRLLGRPVEWVEAAKSETQTAVTTAMGFYGDFSKFIIAQGRGMTSKILDQATIIDVDDSTEILLGAQDMEALRMTERLDMLVALPSAFVKLVTSTT